MNLTSCHVTGLRSAHHSPIEHVPLIAAKFSLLDGIHGPKNPGMRRVHVQLHLAKINLFMANALTKKIREFAKWIEIQALQIELKIGRNLKISHII